MDPDKRKQNEYGSKFKTLVMKSFVNGECTLICQYLMGVIGTYSPGRASVGLKTSVGHLQLQGKRKSP